MVKKMIFCGIVTALSAIAFVACDKDDSNNSTPQEPQEEIKGYFSNSSGCKSNGLRNGEIEDTLVTYEFDLAAGEGTITSKNVELNCCPTNLSSITKLTSTGIEINAYEAYSEISCDCVCPYDIETKITGISAREYHFIVDGTAFDVDLSKETKGFVIGERRR